MLKKIQKTSISYILRSATHVERITITRVKVWNQMGKLTLNRVIKKRVRTLTTSKLLPKLELEPLV